MLQRPVRWPEREYADGPSENGTPYPNGVEVLTLLEENLGMVHD